MKFSLEDVLVNDEGIVVGKRVNSSNHLVDQDTKCPPVYWFSMALILENLGSKVLRSATEGKCSIFDGFGKAEVSELEVTVSTNEDVLGL